MSSYPRVMPNIKPYPQQQPQQQQSFEMSVPPSYHASYQQPMYQQQQLNYSVYRPAYHRIPSTPAIPPRQSKDAWASMSPEVSPIIVPSMSPITIRSQLMSMYQGMNFGYPSHASPVHRPTANYNQTPAMASTPTTATAAVAAVATVDMPIHHTLENATIAYDTTPQYDLQKELVKDVFFSPAMVPDNREMSPSDFSSDSESEMASTPPSQTFSPCETPSDFLINNHSSDLLFDFGLDLATTCSTSNQSTTTSYKEVVMAAAAAAVKVQQKSKPSFSLSAVKSFDLNNSHSSSDLPTPPASLLDKEYTFQLPTSAPQNKRRSSDSVLQDRQKKKHRCQASFDSAQLTSTPPDSPLSYDEYGISFETPISNYFEEAVSQ